MYSLTAGYRKYLKQQAEGGGFFLRVIMNPGRSAWARGLRYVSMRSTLNLYWYRVFNNDSHYYDISTLTYTLGVDQMITSVTKHIAL
jgi:hypothetical protein